MPIDLCPQAVAELCSLLVKQGFDERAACSIVRAGCDGSPARAFIAALKELHQQQCPACNGWNAGFPGSCACS